MAVYTQLTDAELDALLADYDIGRAVSFKGISEGVSNTNFKLETEKGRFILTIFERRTEEVDLPFFMGVMARLAERNFPCPQPVPTKHGALLTRAQGKPATIVTFLQGASPHDPDIAHCAAIGEALARMHVALDGFEMQRANSLGPDAWAKLIAPRLAQAEYLRPGLARLIESDMAEVTQEWPRDLPRGVIHADLFPDNSLFVGDRLGGVIDFYFACTDFLAYDIAVCLNAWCFEDQRHYDIGRGAALLAAYETIRPLSDAERNALPTLCRGAGLRFFATRLEDWGNVAEDALVKPKDPREYADILTFHRSVKDAGDYGA